MFNTSRTTALDNGKTDNVSLVMRKAVFRVSDQVCHKLAYAHTDEGINLEILGFRRRGIVLSI